MLCNYFNIQPVSFMNNRNYIRFDFEYSWYKIQFCIKKFQKSIIVRMMYCLEISKGLGIVSSEVTEISFNNYVWRC